MVASISNNSNVNNLSNAGDIQRSGKKPKLVKSEDKKNSDNSIGKEENGAAKIDGDKVFSALSEILPNVDASILEQISADADFSAASTPEELAEMLEQEVNDLLAGKKPVKKGVTDAGLKDVKKSLSEKRFNALPAAQ